MRAKTTIVSLVAGGVVLVVAGGAALLATLDINQYRQDIAAMVQAETGRSLEIDGPLKLSFAGGLHPTIVAEKVRLANLAEGSEPSMFTVERIEARVDLLSALRRRVQVEKLALLRPRLVLERVKGQPNWELRTHEAAALAEGAAAPAAGGEASAVSGSEVGAGASSGTALPILRALTIVDGEVIYRGGKAEQRLVLRSLSAETSNAASPMQVAVLGAYGETEFDVKGMLGALDIALGVKKGGYLTKIGGHVGGVSFALDGAISDLKNMDGFNHSVSLSAPSLEGLKPLLGKDLPPVPPLSLSMKAKGGASTWELSDITATAGSSNLAGVVFISMTGQRPRVSMTLNSQLLSLQEMLGTSHGDPAKGGAGGVSAPAPSVPSAPSGRVFPQEPLPWFWLKTLDVNAVISVSKMILQDGIMLNGVSARVDLANGDLGLSPVSVHMGDGIVTLSGTAEPITNSDRGKIDATLTLSGVSLGKLFEQIKRPDLVSGAKTDAKVYMRAQGASVADLMGSLNGNVQVSVDEGRIHNSLLDWAGADLITQVVDKINPFTDADPVTELSCLAVNVPIKDGWARWDRAMAMQTSKMNFVTSGETDLKKETLDVALRPTSRNVVGISAGRLVEMLRIRGSYADPAIGLDEGAIARNAVSVAGAVASGGVSLLAEHLLGAATTDTDPCRTALNGGKPVEAHEMKNEKATKPTATVEKTLDSMGKALGGLLKK